MVSRLAGYFNKESDKKARRSRLAGAFKQLPSDYAKVAKDTGEVLKSFARAPGRAAYSVGASIGEGISEMVTGRKLTDEERALQPKTRLAKFAFGEEPVRTISLQKERTQKFLEDVGVGTKASKAAALPLVVGGTLLDLLPGGGSGKKVAQKVFTEIAASKEIPVIVKSLKNIIGGTDESVESLAKNLVDVDDPKKVEEIISLATKKVEPKVIDDIAQTPEAQVLKESEQVIPPAGVVDESPEVVQAFEESKGVLQSTWQNLRETFEDSMIRLKELERTPGVNLDKAKLSPWERKQLLASRTSARLNELKERSLSIVDDIKQSSKGVGVDENTFRKEVNEFLIAQHAPERNLRVGKPKAAGISDEEAAKKIAEISAKEYFPQVKEVANKMLKLNSEVLDLLKDNGLISSKLFDELRSAYKLHVPLMRVMDDKLSETISTLSRKLDVKSSGIIKAKGSEKKVEDILENIALNYERAINLAERNKFAQSFYEFAENNKQTGLFKIVSDNAMIDPLDAKNFGVRIDGKQKWIQVEDPKLGAALKGINMQNMPPLGKFIETYGRIMSQFATRFNPDYLLSGFIRDTQEMVVSAMAAKDIKAAGVLSKLPNSMQTIIKNLRGIDDADTQLYKQFMQDGGGMGGMALSTKRDAIKIDLAQVQGDGKKLGKAFIEKIDSLNEVFENANRFSVYQDALKKGLSRDRAALLAQESTINFSRKGTGGPIINGLYMFANASIQGSTKMLRAMKNPKVAAAVVATIGTTVALTDQWNDSIDPEWRSKIPEGTRSQNLIIMLPTEGEDLEIIKIPVSWGLRPIKVTADVISDVAHSGEIKGKDVLNRIGSALIDGYNPLGGSTLRQALTPTIGDIGSDIATNETFSGGPIKPDTYGKPVPESERYFRSLQDSLIGRGFIKGSKFLADSVGIEVSPADINYGYQQLIGGTGRFVSKIVNTFDAIGKGKVPESYDIPIAGRFYQSVDPEYQSSLQEKQATDIGDYLTEQERERAQVSRSVKNALDEINALPNAEAKFERLKQIYAQDKELGEKILEQVKEEQYGYTSEEKKIKQLGVENGARAQYLVSKVNKMKDDKAKMAYLADLYNRKIISKQVADQIKYLLNNQ